MKRKISIVFLFCFLACSTQVFYAFSYEIQVNWDYTTRTYYPRNVDMFKDFNATDGFRLRQETFLNNSINNNGLNAQASRIYLNKSVNNGTIENTIEDLEDPEDLSDFTWSSIVRLLYLDRNKSLIDADVKDRVIKAMGNAKYWFTESTTINDDIIFTENHQILCHTAEYLMGQMFPNDTFPYSGMTGNQHEALGKYRILKWLDWRARLGFQEWNSNNYLNPDIASLVNLVDFAMDSEIVNKSAMVLDMIAFGFACNYFKNRFAVSQGRCYDDRRVVTSGDGISEAAWIMLGLGEHQSSEGNDRASVTLATSDYYAPPPILEMIAQNASQNFEHKERHSIYMSEGEKYGIKYTAEDINFWWGMSAPMAPRTIQVSFDLLKKYSINPNTMLGPQILVDFLQVMAFLKGLSLRQYSETLSAITRGVTLQTANIYTYRTPYYQLSGAQDHMKGMDGMQEHIWQASLSDYAYVFTNSPGGLTKNFNQLYMGGWKPRGTFYKNMGVIQYDREPMPIEGEILVFLLNVIGGMKFYQHAYFPKSEFDEVYLTDKWSMGSKDGGYVALYSHEPTYWASDYELRVNSIKNVWIIELGSVAEYGSFENFKTEMLAINMEIIPESVGYDVKYTSPSQGAVSVSWDDPFYVGGGLIDLGDYKRFDNQYCQQEFGTDETYINFGNETLTLNFNNCSRVYVDAT